MKIKGLYSKEKREVEDLQIVSYKQRDKYGKLNDNLYVEYMVIGKTSKWKDFMKIEDFKKLNPSIKVKGA